MTRCPSPNRCPRAPAAARRVRPASCRRRLWQGRSIPPRAEATPGPSPVPMPAAARFPLRQGVRRNEAGGDGYTGDGHPVNTLRSPAEPLPPWCTTGAAVGDPEDGAANERPRGDEETGQCLFAFGHGGELALEGLAGPPEQRLDGPDLDAFVVHDLLVRPPRSLAHGEDVPVTRRQPVQGPVDQLAVDGGEDELLGSVLSDDAEGVPCSELLHVLGRHASVNGAAACRCRCSRRSRSARGRSAARRRNGGAPSTAGKRFLRRVLGLVAIVQSTEAKRSSLS